MHPDSNPTGELSDTQIAGKLLELQEARDVLLRMAEVGLDSSKTESEGLPQERPRPVFAPRLVNFGLVLRNDESPASVVVEVLNEGGAFLYPVVPVIVGTFWRAEPFTEVPSEDARRGVLYKFEIHLELRPSITSGERTEYLSIDLDGEVARLPISVRIGDLPSASYGASRPPYSSARTSTSMPTSRAGSSPTRPASSKSSSATTSPYKDISIFVQQKVWAAVLVLVGAYFGIAAYFQMYSDELAAQPDLKDPDTKAISQFDMLLDLRPVIAGVGWAAVVVALLEWLAIHQRARKPIARLLGILDASVSLSAGVVVVGIGYFLPYSMSLSDHELVSGWFLLINLVGLVVAVVGGLLLVLWAGLCLYNLFVAIGGELPDSGPSRLARSRPSSSTSRATNRSIRPRSSPDDDLDDDLDDRELDREIERLLHGRSDPKGWRLRDYATLLPALVLIILLFRHCR